MKVTKLEHACLDISNGSDRFIIDPGMFAQSLTDLAGIMAMVITHVHADHFDEEKVNAIIAANPDIHIFTSEQVAQKLPNGLTTVPATGQQYTVGSFTLEFFGGRHANIIEGYPPAGADQNFGVLVNDKLYYPGDSVTPCPKPHTALAAPAMAPWLKLKESAELIKNDGSTDVFPTHNGFMNDAGNDLTNNLLSGVAEQSGKTYHSLKAGDSIDV